MSRFFIREGCHEGRLTTSAKRTSSEVGAIQPVTLLIPLRNFLVILRGIFLKGVGLEVR
jgi:hypothetical protein